MWKEEPPATANDIGFPRGVTTEELATAEGELKTFAETTLEHLIKAERLAYHYTPSISLFCRLDIGVMPDNKGHLQYFVNEVTRGPTMTCLFSHGVDVEEVAPNLGADFANAFHQYLCDKHSDSK
jgi:hypothetical protein